jgi:endoglucanase
MLETRDRSASVRQTRSPRMALALLLCSGLALAGCGNTTQDQSEVLHVRADQVLDRDGKPVWLRGVEFGNWAFSDVPDLTTANTYANQDDYPRVAAMGANTILFYFRSDQFESDAAPGQYLQGGFDWLDQNIAWARSSGIRLVLTLAAPPGSPQWLTACDGSTVWDVAAYQDRTVALWQALARRYAGEPVIAGYDLLSDPLPTVSTEQWQSFADRIISAMRVVDHEHILVIEPAQGAACTYKGVLDATDLFRVKDPNVIYAFNAVVPWEYVAQLIPSQSPGDGGSYPDETRLGDLPWNQECGAVDCMQWKEDSYQSTPGELELALQPDETSWTEKSFVYRVTNPDDQIGEPVLQSDNNSGKVYFDDFVVKEYDQDLNFVRTVLDVDIEDLSPWYLYQGFSDGTQCTDCPAAKQLESDAHRGNFSISISGSTSQANLSNGSLCFPVKLNYTYEMSGFLKGQDSQPNSSSRFRLDFLKYNKNNGVLPLRNKDNLALYLQSFIAWGNTQHAPLYVNDFGAGRPTFTSDKGGLRWAEDMIDLLKANNLHFAYDEYHGDDFGIYPGNQGLLDPGTVNQPLVDLLARELAQ